MAANAVFVPMAVQAFVVTEDFPQSNYRIAPLIQPNYASLRAEGLLTHDVIEKLQLSPHRLLAKHNTRFVDLATGEVRKERVGVYLSWTMPRMYRQGITATTRAAVDHAAAELKAGYTYELKDAPSRPDEAAHTKTKFRPIPTRYLIFRIAYPRNSSAPSSEIFVLESDRIRNINDTDLDHLDIENLTAPFLDPDLPAKQQSEALLGLRHTLQSYKPNPEAPRRVPLTIVESGNDLFADFQPHNNSVLSLHDDLGFGTKRAIKDATLTYMVIGFHANAEDDPLCVAMSIANDSRPSYGTLLDACGLRLGEFPILQGPSRPSWLDTKADPTSARVICHGTLRNIPFQRSGLNMEAKSPSILLQDLVRKHHPIAIGTNTLDALLAFLRVQYADDAQGKAQTTQTLSKMVQLIVASDNMDAQEKAEDQISTNDWIPIASGTVWSVSQSEQDKGQGTLSLSLEDVDALVELNDSEAALASMLREKQHLYQQIFFHWWGAMEVRGTALDAAQQKHKAAVGRLLREIKDLDHAIKTLYSVKEKVKAMLSTKLTLEAVAAPSFGVHQDPTVLFAGVPSGWPLGFANKVTVRSSSQLPASPDLQPLSQKLNISGWNKLIGNYFPDAAPFIRQIVPEVLGPNSSPSPAYAYLKEEDFGNAQGWFPLFIEWELEYHHIDFIWWDFDRDSDGNWRYDLNRGRSLTELLDPDARQCRKISGRTPITPQASSVLRSRLRQLFSRAAPADRKTDVDTLMDQALGIEYFSTPLAGLRDHLMTRIQGAHVQPHPGDELSQELGLSESDMMHLSTASDRAPYGRLAKVEGHSPAWCGSFYPVTHGQFLFTKLHIVDKFGQIVSCVEPETLDAPRTALYPCLSPHFSCQPFIRTWSPGDPPPWPNTVYKADTSPGLCQFFQVPPRFNQEARLNATFVVETQATTGSEPVYRSITHFDNPIWGWIIVSNLDKSLQVFNAAGRFVREFSLVLDSKTVVIPSPPPEVHRASAGVEPGAKNTSGGRRLATLVRNLASFPYALGMLTMLEEAYQATSSNAAEHAEFLPVVFGRAFCLADFGCSIELACPILENTCTQHPPGGPPISALGGGRYPIGLGNAGAGFDGLAGYFNTVEDLGIQNVFSEFGDERKPADPPGPYPNPVVRRKGPSLTLRPFHPGVLRDRTVAEYNWVNRAATELRSVILDPMRPLHLYSGGLFPMKEVVLPRWAVGSAMKEMHAFFSAGPLLVPHLPPPNDIRTSTVQSDTKKEPAVEMAVSGLEDWSWWQARAGSGRDEATWSKYPVQAVDGNLDLTASGNQSEFVEGFFMMNKNLKEATNGGAN